jgi:hypothetical protein
VSRATSRTGAALLAITLLTSACGGEEAAAATVNGERIPVSSVDRDLADIAENEAYVEARTRQGVPFRGTEPGTYDAATVAALLSRRVTALLVRQEARRRGITATLADLAQAREALRRQLVDPANGASLLEGFPDRYVAEQARIQAESDLLQAAEGRVALDEAALRAAYEADSDRYRVWCVRWILYGPTIEDAGGRASAAQAAIAAGADFAEVARRESGDTGSAGRGGALGCQTRDGLARLGDAFRDVAVTLAPGEVSAPTSGDVGTFLVQATDVKVRPFDEVRASVRAQVLVPARQAYEQLLRRLRREATVVVSSRFGTWDRSDPDAVTIVPPGGRPTTTAPGPTTTSSPVGP